MQPFVVRARLLAQSCVPDFTCEASRPKHVIDKRSPGLRMRAMRRRSNRIVAERPIYGIRSRTLVLLLHRAHSTMYSAARQSALRAVRISSLQQRQSFATPLARLLSSLALLEQREGKLNPGALAAVTAAKKLGGTVIGFVAGINAKSVAEDAAKIQGLDKVVFVDSAAYDKVHEFGGTTQRQDYETDLSNRDCLKTTRRCSWRISRKRAFLMS